MNTSFTGNAPYGIEWIEQKISQPQMTTYIWASFGINARKNRTWWLCESVIVVFDRVDVPSYDRSVGSQFKDIPKYLRGNIWMGIPSILMILSPILPRLDRCYISKTGSACLPRWQIIPTIETSGLHGGPKKRHPVPYCKSHALESCPINHLCRAAVYRSGRGQLFLAVEEEPAMFSST